MELTQTSKVAMRSIVDNVTTQAVETLLVGRLRDLLSPARIIQMKPDLVDKIAAESSDNRLNMKVIQLLLQQGADVYVKDREGLTPLRVISNREDNEVYKLLARHANDSGCE